VGVVAPGYALRRAPLEAGVRVLERLRFRVRVGAAVLHRNGYLAGTDEERAADLNDLIRDPEVRAIWFARGGYGTSRILDRVDWRALRRDPKPLIGYSDATALFARALRNPRQVCHYAPVVTELGDTAAWHRASLVALLGGRTTTQPFAARQVVVPGRARGRLAGGNLTVLAALAGTRFAPDLRDAVLLLEETGEPTYRIDRMLTQFRQAGWLDRVQGVLLGHFAVPPRKHFPPDRELAQVIEEALVPLGVPVIRDLPVGHLNRKRSVPLGAEVTLDTQQRRLRFAP